MKFDVALIVEGDADASEENLAHALKVLLSRAARFSPDRRFDWSRIDVAVTAYAGAKTPKP